MLLYKQIYQTVCHAIVTGLTPLGAALPSTRSLAKTLGVSRNTVITAYETLVSEGLLIAKSGSATRVCAAVGSRPRLKARCLDPDLLLRNAHYARRAIEFIDPDGNRLFAYRS